MQRKINSELLSTWQEFNKAFMQISVMLGSRNIVGEFAEILACKYYDAEKAPASQKGYDLTRKDDGKRIQVKSRRIPYLRTVHLSPIRDWELFDILVVIIFSETGQLLHAWEIDSKSARAFATDSVHVNGDILRTTHELLTKAKARDITEDLKKLMK